MTDLTRSPQPNKLANLYRLERDAEDYLRNAEELVKMKKQHLRQIRAKIKRACGDRETQS